MRLASRFGAVNLPRNIAKWMNHQHMLGEEEKKAYEQRAHIRAQQSRRGRKLDTLTREVVGR